jgi:hypothetical protein
MGPRKRPIAQTETRLAVKEGMSQIASSRLEGDQLATEDVGDEKGAYPMEMAR